MPSSKDFSDRINPCSLNSTRQHEGSTPEPTGKVRSRPLSLSSGAEGSVAMPDNPPEPWSRDVWGDLWPGKPALSLSISLKGKVGTVRQWAWWEEPHQTATNPEGVVAIALFCVIPVAETKKCAIFSRPCYN